tara:strand:- start:91 stop:579 length:489 start_codon:yes stop_codon:yes gene_type:complete
MNRLNEFKINLPENIYNMIITVNSRIRPNFENRETSNIMLYTRISNIIDYYELNNTLSEQMFLFTDYLNRLPTNLQPLPNIKLNISQFNKLKRGVMGKSLLEKLEKKDLDKCMICMDTIKSRQHVSLLNCGHSYHIHCSRKWLTKMCKKPCCPLCRKDVRLE